MIEIYYIIRISRIAVLIYYIRHKTLFYLFEWELCDGSLVVRYSGNWVILCIMNTWCPVLICHYYLFLRWNTMHIRHLKYIGMDRFQFTIIALCSIYVNSRWCSDVLICCFGDVVMLRRYQSGRYWYMLCSLDRIKKYVCLYYQVNIIIRILLIK